MSGWVQRALALRRAAAEAVGSDRYSYLSLNGLDRQLRRHLRQRNGFFVEAGANDGIAQSNTYWFERFAGWRGLLIEGIPELASRCRRNRPRSITVQAALVADDAEREVRMRTANLMSIVSGAFGSQAADDAHVHRGLDAQALRNSDELIVPARTLSSILREQGSPAVDLLSLDVEGYEAQALRGLDLATQRPHFILVETRTLETIDGMLAGAYERIDQLSHHDYLYRRRDS